MENHAEAGAAALWNYRGTATVLNSTIGNNETSGAIILVTGGLVTVSSSTIARNITDGNVIHVRGSRHHSALLTLENTITSNFSPNIHPHDAPKLPAYRYGDIRVSGTSDAMVQSLGHNLIAYVVPDKRIVLDEKTDIFSLDVLDRAHSKAGLPADNGGLTPTMAIPPFSDALDNGSRSAPGLDQRGQSRYQKPDIGAYEWRPISFNPCQFRLNSGCAYDR